MATVRATAAGAPSRSWRLPGAEAALIAAAVLLACVFGALVAVDPKLAGLLLAAAVLVPLGLWNTPALVAIWVFVVYVGGLAGLEAFPNRMLDLVLACGIIVLCARAVRRETVVPSGRAILPIFAAFVFWQLFSLIWAVDVGFAQQQVKDLVYLSIGFVLVLAFVRTARDVRWIAMAFVLGGVASVAGGIADGGLTAATSGVGVDTATSRFAGGSGDPNYLAAMLVPALMLAGGLSVRRSAPLRLALLVSVALMATGLAATQSRGGLIALAVAFAAAYVLLRDQRRFVVGAMGAALTGLAAFFVAYPAAWERIVAVKDAGTGSGRTDIWHVAWSIISEHPLIGVGLNQFSVVSPTYVRQPGSLGGATGLIVNEHIVVHNVYLQLWAETGLIGVGLFVAVLVVGFAGALRAARDFDLVGDRELATLSRAVVLALIGVLTASFFLSNILARQTWVLLALGPVLAVVAGARVRGDPRAERAPARPLRRARPVRLRAR